jgi:hypothetical protein
MGTYTDLIKLKRRATPLPDVEVFPSTPDTTDQSISPVEQTLIATASPDQEEHPQVDMKSGTPVHQNTRVPEREYDDGSEHRYTGTPVHPNTNPPEHRYTGTPAHRNAGTPKAVPNPSLKGKKVKHTFVVYAEQVRELNNLVALVWQQTGTKPELGEWVRDALDSLIQKKRKELNK